MAERLYGLAIDHAAPSGFERVYDLYCGIGTIALLVSPRVAEVWGLEIATDAITDAIANARANEVDNARFFAGDVRLALRDLVTEAGRRAQRRRHPPSRRQLSGASRLAAGHPGPGARRGGRRPRAGGAALRARRPGDGDSRWRRAGRAGRRQRASAHADPRGAVVQR